MVDAAALWPRSARAFCDILGVFEPAPKARLSLLQALTLEINATRESIHE
jgi:hypothetical protein